jgi:hypothetical protein
VIERVGLRSVYYEIERHLPTDLASSWRGSYFNAVHETPAGRIEYESRERIEQNLTNSF